MTIIRTCLLVLVLLAAACTPTDVTNAFAQTGIDITNNDAQAIADWFNNQDCLPQYEATQYVECAITDAAATYGLDPTWLARIAWCESGLEPEARNPSSTATGLFQFLESTWDWIADNGAPHTNLPRTHARANAHNAAWLITRRDLGGAGHWTASASCWGRQLDLSPDHTHEEKP